MFKNYLKTAWRNIFRSKVYALINIFGLSMGLACAILIYSLVSYHLSFDNFHKNKERIYRVVSKTMFGEDDYSQGIPQPIGKALRNDYAFFETVAMRADRNNSLVSINDNGSIKKFSERTAFVEPAYFDIFNYPMVEGNAAVALREPNTVIITQSLAHKFFGNQPAVGKQLKLSNQYDCIITGVLKDIPANTDNRREIYISYETYKKVSPWMASDSSWGSISSGVQCFGRLKPGIHPGDVEKVFPAMIAKYDPEDKPYYQFYMQPLSKIHFDTQFDGKIDKKYLWALGIIGLFLVITACINFINIATAQSLGRSKEIGVRKTLGSSRLQVFRQFMSETFLLVGIAILLSLGIAWLCLPALNRLFSVEISIHFFTSFSFIAFGLLLFLVVSFFAGYYPGLLLSRFKPVEALKGKITQQQAGGFSLRKGLLAVQFFIVQLMIIGAIVIAQQMHYSLQSDLGFHRNGIVQLTVPSSKPGTIQTLRSRFASISGISNISFFSNPPMSDGNDWNTFTYDNRPKEEVFQLNMKRADDQYLSLFGLQLVAGRNLYPSDTANGCLLNETAVKKLQAASPQAILGKTIKLDKRFVPIVGVVKDFHNESFHAGIDPVCIYSNAKNYYTCAIRLPLQHVKAALPAIEKVWNQTFPDYIYSYTFFDDDIASLYQTETTLLNLIEIFACIAIAIGCMGLFGLVSFMAAQKRKEIGVRKVLGASVQSVLWLFGKEFSKLIIIAFVFAVPLAWVFMHYWLRNFIYHINIEWGVFLLALCITFVIVICTIAYTSLRAATANPVKSLRTE